MERTQRSQSRIHWDHPLQRAQKMLKTNAKKGPENPLNSAKKTALETCIYSSGVQGNIEKSFLWPPLYRAPFFPVLFDTGKRRYYRELKKSKDEEKAARLVQMLHMVNDELQQKLLMDLYSQAPPTPSSRSIVQAIQSTWDTHMPISYSRFVMWLDIFVFYVRDYLRHWLGRSTMFIRQRGRQITSAENKIFTRAKSLPDIIPLRNSFEEFTPDITADEHDETFRFQCSSPGLYQCSVTGLLFHMEGEGDVVYRIVPWNRRLLAQHHKRPAGPLFDITCLQQSVCQLHLPHCEIRSTGGGEFLSVAHLSDEDIEFIAPHEITETHVVINITGFSAFGNVKDEDSPPDPVRAQVLLFYRPPADPEPESIINVLLLPRNVVLRDVVHNRKKLVGPENYIETSSDCKLRPKQEYTLSTCPEDDSVLVQPTEAEFDSDSYDDYFPTFQVELEKIMKHIKLFLRDTNEQSVWKRRVCLWSTAVKRSCGSSALNLPPHEKLLDIRSSFIEGISGPVLKVLLDKLFKKKVMTDAERESADEMQNQRDKARFVIDTVRRKGEAASSEMIEFLFEADPFLCEHLGLS